VLKANPNPPQAALALRAPQAATNRVKKSQVALHFAQKGVAVGALYPELIYECDPRGEEANVKRRGGGVLGLVACCGLARRCRRRCGFTWFTCARDQHDREDRKRRSEND